MDRTRRYTASFSNPASAGAYAAGDEISNSTTAGSVVFPTFDLRLSVRKGRVDAAGAVINTFGITLDIEVP
jgi:hypothetical protein